MINLKTQFGKRYKVTHEDNACRTDPWLMTLECHRGHVCLWTQDRRLAACTNHRGPIVKQLLAIPSAKLEMDGDDGVNVSFSPADIRAVLAILKPRKRRRVSDKERERLRELSRLHRDKGLEVLRKRRENNRRRHRKGLYESEAAPAA